MSDENPLIKLLHCHMEHILEKHVERLEETLNENGIEANNIRIIYHKHVIF